MICHKRKANTLWLRLWRPTFVLLLSMIVMPASAQVYDLHVEGLSAPLGIETTQPHFSWKNTLTHNSQQQRAYEIEVASDSLLLRQGKADLWRSGRIASHQQVRVPYQGKELAERQLCYWRLRTWDEKGNSTPWSRAERFAVGPLLGLSASFIGCGPSDSLAQTPMFRSSFHTSGNNLVFVHVNSLGYHELYINGQRVGDKVLQPAVSQLNKRTLIVTYDVTPYLTKGNNQILLWVGQGWGRIYHTDALVQAEVCELNKGSWRTLLKTNSIWEASPSAYSYTGSWQPLQFGGECVDSRLQPKWNHAKEIAAEGIHSSPQQFEGNTFINTLTPQTITMQSDGSLLLDFGRVITGWLNIRFQPMAKDSVATMEYADHIPPGGSFSPQGESDLYISNGTLNPFFCNKFHYHAFRYVRLTGAAIKEAEALQFSALQPHRAANFACSDQRLNAIHDLIKYTLSCLTYSGYMVDCPHLERMGYGGDGNSSTPTLQTLYDVSSTYYNWLTAWQDAVADDGELAYVAPDYRTGGGPYWSGFIIKAPWRTYLNYGDDRMVQQLYEYMKRWLAYLQSHTSDGLLQPWPDNERHTWFLGDWLAPEGIDVHGASAKHVSNCFLSECLADMAQMSMMLGRTNEAQTFLQQRNQLNTAIHSHFYHPQPPSTDANRQAAATPGSIQASYANVTPLDLAYALLAGVPPDSATTKAVKEQLIDISYNKHNTHLAVGLVGIPIFTQWAIQERQANLMAALLRQPDYPGYLHMISQGATTTWESWNGDRSHVHNCYNGIGIWFYQALAGIRPDPEAPGYRHFFIDPQPVSGITWVKASQPTPYGNITIAIQADTMTVTVPVGTTATVFPGTDHQQTLTAGKWTVNN